MFVFISIFAALCHFDPSQATSIRDLCFSWTIDILDSGYTAVEQYWMAGKVVELAWKQVESEISQSDYKIQSAWVPPLLGFLQLSETFYSAGPQPAPGALALRILAAHQGYGDFCPTILLILTSTLLPTHPLRSRRSALTVFRQLISGWLSSRMESVANNDRARLLQAIGDPFISIPDSLLQADRRLFISKYEPMWIAMVLVEFSSSGLWRDHLRRSNFTSCEEVTSTAEGKKTAFGYMQRVASTSWSQFLCSPAKIITAIKTLEELQCPNTAEVVLMWAWTFGVVDAVDHRAWRLIGRRTLGFYQAHGTGRLKILPRHIMDHTSPRTRRWDHWCRVEGVRLPVRIAEGVRMLGSREDYLSDSPLARVCRLRRLYQLFGCDPATWEELVVVEVAEEVDVSLGRSLNRVFSMDCGCDYP